MSKTIERLQKDRDKEIQARVEKLVAKDWTIEAHSYEDGSYFAEVAELPGCMTEADTWSELGEMIRDALEGWLYVAVEHGDDIPEPRTAANYSGRFLVRTSTSLHRRLSERARNEGVSMNQWVVESLAEVVGEKAMSE